MNLIMKANNLISNLEKRTFYNSIYNINGKNK